MSRASKKPEREAEAIVGGPTGEVPGSVLFTCVQCGGAVWLAPSGQRAREARNLPALCVPCAIPMMFEKKDVEIRVAEGAIDELLDSIRRDTERN
jgi:hypothetical protein